jgi:hypothetical protein
MENLCSLRSLLFKSGSNAACGVGLGSCLEVMEFWTELLDVPLGLLINFHGMNVTDGISRLLLRGANL